MSRARSRVPPDVAPWVPSLEEAREAGCEVKVRRWLRSFDLLRREPVAVTTWAALRLDAKVLLRRTRAERVEVPATLAVRGAIPAPPSEFGARVSHFVIQQVEGHQILRCSGCSYSPGCQLCGICGGEGVITMDSSGDGSQSRRCSCLDGTVACSTCQGTGEARFVQALYVDYETEALDIVRVPSTVRGPIYELMDTIQDGPAPDALRFSLDQSLGSGPYRNSAPGKLSAWGFGLGNTAKNVSALLDRFIGRETLGAEVGIWAWPFLHIEHSILGRRCNLLLVKNPRGSIRTILHSF